MQKTNNLVSVIGVCILIFSLLFNFIGWIYALPKIQTEYFAEYNQLAWLLIAPLITMAIFALLLRQLLLQFGWRRVIYYNFLLLALTTLIAITSSSSKVLIFVRALNGITFCTLPFMLTWLHDNISPKAQSNNGIFYRTLVTIIVAIAAISCSILIDKYSWRVQLWYDILLIIAGLGICLFTLRNESPVIKNTALNWLTALFFGISLGSIVIAITAVITFHLHLIALLSVAIVAGICFWQQESNSPTFLNINTSNLSKGLFFPCVTTYFVSGMFAPALLFLVPLYLQNILHHSSGYVSNLFIATLAIATLTSLLHKTTSIKKQLLYTLIFLLLATLCQQFFSPHSSSWLIVLMFVFVSVATGKLFSLPQEMIKNRCLKRENLPHLIIIFILGCILGLCICVLFLKAATDPRSFMHGFYGFLWVLMGIITAAIYILILKR